MMQLLGFVVAHVLEVVQRWRSSVLTWSLRVAWLCGSVSVHYYEGPFHCIVYLAVMLV